MLKGTPLAAAVLLLLLALNSPLARVAEAACKSATAPPYVAVHGRDASGFGAEVVARKGWTLKVVSFYTMGTKLKYASIWQKLPTAPAIHPVWGRTSAQITADRAAKAAAGYYTTWINGYTDASGNNFFAAKYDKVVTKGIQVVQELTSAQFESKVGDMVNQGYCLKWISAYGRTISTIRFAGVFSKDNCPTEWYYWLGLDRNAFIDKYNFYVKTKGLKLNHVNAYTAAAFIQGGTPVGQLSLNVAIFSNIGPSYTYAQTNMSPSQYQCEFNNHGASAWSLVHVSGATAGKSSNVFSAIWQPDGSMLESDMKFIDTKSSAFMTERLVPALTLAISQGGKLVYSRAFGTQVKDTYSPVCPSTRMRIASVSKPVTSAAIYKLMEKLGPAKLNLDTKIFGPNSIFGNTYGVVALGSRLNRITVRHLLEHTAGGQQWDNNKDPNTTVDNWGDPMFFSGSMSQTDIIKYMLANVPLTTTPGTLYEYSNFGFMVAARVIEKLTGVSYMKWTKDNLLTPCKAKGMEVGGDTLLQRKTDEVVYPDPDSYNIKVARMDGNGGWISSAQDLVRFATCVDGYTSRADKLKASSVSSMTTRTMARNLAGNTVNYAKGWGVTNDWWSHNGSLEGTASLLITTRNADPSKQWTIALVATTTSRAKDSEGRTINDDLWTLAWDILNGLDNPMPCRDMM